MKDFVSNLFAWPKELAPLERKEFQADLHTHTVSSGHAYGTIWENAKAAYAKGLKVIAITDHGPSLPGAPGLYYFNNLRVLPKILNGVRVLRSIEANIISEDGGLDVPEEILSKLDLVVAGLHPGTGIDDKGIEWNTKAVVNAIEKSSLDIVAHPGNSAFPTDPHSVVDAALSHGKAIEINDNTFIARPNSINNCSIIARLCAEKGAYVAVSSDAHAPFSIGEIDRAWNLAKEQGIRSEQVINYTVESLARFLEQRGKKQELI